MQFPIKMSSEDGKPSKMALIELQGELKSHDSEDINQQKAGNLFYQNNTPILTIGHHVLLGKEVTLPKKLALVEKELDTNEYTVTAIIEKKLIFNSPPKPIISRSH